MFVLYDCNKPLSQKWIPVSKSPPMLLGVAKMKIMRNLITDFSRKLSYFSRRGYMMTFEEGHMTLTLKGGSPPHDFKLGSPPHVFKLGIESKPGTAE